MEAKLIQAGEAAIDEARHHKVEAEAFLINRKELSLEVAEERLENLKRSQEMGIGIRVIAEGRMGFAYSSDLSKQAIRSTVEDALRISRFTAVDYHHILPGRQEYQAPEACDARIAETALEDKVDLALTLERIARGVDQRIPIVERAGYEDVIFSNIIMNTNGLMASASASFCGLFISLVAQEEQDVQSGYAMMVKKKWADLDPDQVGREAAEDALRSLGAVPIPSERLPCIMEPRVVVRFLALIAQTVGADAVQKGKSMFAGKLGQQVASASVSIQDDPFHPEGIASLTFDGEGVASQSHYVIDKGFLKGYLYDSYTASRDGVSSTGNGQRFSFRSLPTVAPSNMILEAGEESREQLMADIDRGLYITDVMGMHTANPISGDFSVGAAGLLIENGHLSRAVRGVTIAGNLIDLLHDIEAVGSDLRFMGSKAAPSIRLSALSISGD